MSFGQVATLIGVTNENQVYIDLSDELPDNFNIEELIGESLYVTKSNIPDNTEDNQEDNE